METGTFMETGTNIKDGSKGYRAYKVDSTKSYDSITPVFLARELILAEKDNILNEHTEIGITNNQPFDFSMNNKNHGVVSLRPFEEQELYEFYLELNGLYNGLCVHKKLPDHVHK